MTIALLARQRCLNFFDVSDNQIRLTTAQSGVLAQAQKICGSTSFLGRAREDQFAPPAPNGRRRFCQATFTGTDENERDAPEAGLRRSFVAHLPRSESLRRPALDKRVQWLWFAEGNPPAATNWHDTGARPR